MYAYRGLTNVWPALAGPRVADGFGLSTGRPPAWRPRLIPGPSPPPPTRAVEPVAVEHVEFVDQNHPVVKPPQFGDLGDRADRARPGRFDSERKARCRPDSRLKGREWLCRQVIKRGGEVPGCYDRPGRAGDLGQLLRDIRRLPGYQRQIPGRSVPGHERQHLTDVVGNLARQAVKPCPEVGQAHTEGIDDATGALHFYEVNRGRAGDMGSSPLTAGTFFPSVVTKAPG
jgi:hypothetical protein